MNAPEFRLLPDIQAVADHRELAIDRVGVKSMLHPVRIAGRDGVQHTVASFDMYVGLPPHVKGTHMSRFVEVLKEFDEPLSAAGLELLMDRMLDRLEADSGVIEMSFPYFISKRAPVSGVESLMDYRVRLKGESDGIDHRITLQVTAPVTSLCPCSKEISDYGAHNQRSHVTITAEVVDDVTVEDLIGVAEQEASCEVYGLLKRPDEKYVTERAYDNPKFVEDLVRDVALRLNADPRVLAYSVESENFESIHNHSAYAVIEHRKPF